MITVGVDLAAEARRTAVATIEWSAGRAEVRSAELGQADDAIVAAATGATKVGIDAPFGWPEPFIDFVTAHRDGGRLAAHDLGGRRKLAYRLTDQLVIDQGWGRPLSVSADLIGHAAMRAAGLLSGLAAAGYDVDRAGSGLVVEAYPAAALKQWRLPSTGYKGAVGAVVRSGIVDALTARCPWLDLGETEARCRRSDDALDAVICGFIARAAAQGRIARPSAAQLPRARTEGWIGVPTVDLLELVD